MFSFGKAGINVPSEAGVLILGIVIIVLLWTFLSKVAKSGKSDGVDESEGSVGTDRDTDGYGEDADGDPEDFDEAIVEDGLPDPTVYHNVRVVKKSCGIGYSGIGRNQYAVHHMYFNVILAFEDGEEETYEVDEELFNALTEGQTGDLITVGDHFLGFEPSCADR